MNEQKETENEEKKQKISRRDFLKLMMSAGGLTFLAGLGGWKYIIQAEREKLELVELSLRLPHLDASFDGLKIAVVGDIHFGNWMTRERLIPAVDLILEQSPDLIFHTGDFLAGYGWTAEHKIYLKDLTLELKRLSKNIVNIAVMGNHDYWTNPIAVRESLQEANIIELSNTFYTLKRGTAQLHICGVDDIWEKKNDLNALLMELPAGAPAILLAHEPDFADVSASTNRFSLQISGHSHGGQVVIPGYGAPIRSYMGWKYYSGLYKVGEMWQYTNRGIGMGRIPIRYNCRPEITLLTLETE